MPSATTEVAPDSEALNQEQQRELRVYLEQGLPLSPRPYQEIAARLNTSETQVLEQIRHWQQQSLIRRLGLVVKHRQLGYCANAMVVWDIRDQDVNRIAGQLSARPEVSLCYQRPRRLPHWTYNLFCMIHGKDREAVLKQINLLTRELGLSHINKDVLFSYKAFKQQGARYSQRKQTDDRA
ncbi:Lrp/AsnC family transcriptional regulator [Thalassomonas actiniarum]|uniref:siroheme decarboxylase n=2 Tax=Thalassomonas actiniarum TaxID=485447 RepID=A0AAE9YV84_9GAMM|nr:Lrp/AsnC family transcriptional regulator [Thalassomonas actiniarum]